MNAVLGAMNFVLAASEDFEPQKEFELPAWVSIHLGPLDMVATLNQPQYQPWPVEEQVVAIFAGINGYLDDIPTAQIARFQDELREYLRTQGSVYDEIRDQKDLPDELQEKLTSEIEKFKSSFAVKEEESLVGASAE